MSQQSNMPDYVQTVVVKDSKGMEKILLLPKALDLDRPKRSRTAFAKWQLDALESAFTANPYLIGEQRSALARRLGLSETQIKVWYQNRRTKQRKEGHLEMPPLNPFIANGTNHAGTELMDRNPYHHYHPHHASHAMYHQILQSYSGQANLMKIAEDRQPIPDSHATQLSADPTAIEGSIFIRHHQL